jgi:hypothetical protein
MFQLSLVLLSTLLSFADVLTGVDISRVPAVVRTSAFAGIPTAVDFPSAPGFSNISDFSAVAISFAVVGLSVLCVC